MGTKSNKKVVHRHARRFHPMDEGDAFIPDVARSHERLIDDAAEAFAEEFIVTATSAEDVAEKARDEIVTDDLVAYELDEDADLLFV